MSISEVSNAQRLTGNYAKCGIVFATWKDGTQTLGTCAVVGQNDILTAGHVVYDPDKGGWASDLDFYFGADYNNISDTFDSYNFSYSLTDNFKWNAYAWPDQLYSDSNNDTLLSSESKYDIALIGVSKKIGDIVGWFGLDGNRDYTQSAVQVGYPANSTGMMTSTISVTKNSYFDIYESSQDLMGPGSSGGPLYTPDGYIIGVKSGGDSTSATWADIGFLSTTLFEKLSENNSLLGTLTPTYEINANIPSVNEGSTAQFTLFTTNVAAGTVVSYSISGVTVADLQSGGLTGTVTVTSNGNTTISVPIAVDGITEGAETLTLTTQGKSASIIINDTSNASNTVQVYDTDLSGNLLANGAKRYSGTAGNDTINGTAGGDLIYGNDGDDKLYALGGNDQISGLNGNDYLSGGDGDDRLFGSKGDDQIYGGKGTDTATYDGDYSNYTVTVLYNSKNAVSGYKVVDKTGKEGTDTISTDVEYLNFNYGRTIVTLSNGTITANTTNNSPTGAVTISGTIRQNETLNLSNSISDSDGVGALTYKWRVSSDNKTWTDLSSGSTLKLTESEVGKYLCAYVSYVDGKGNTETVSSTATAAVVNVNDAPVGTVSITGIAKSGQVLTASNNLTDLDGLGAISYAWQSSSDGLNWINLSNGTTLTVANTLVGKYIRANATYIDAHGTSESVSSIKTEAVKAVAQQTAVESHNLSVIVDKGILGADAVLLTGLIESIILTDRIVTQHSVQYAGITFDYNQIDAVIMTVTRDDEFTAEFTKEVNEYLKTDANITYKVAVGLVGAANIAGIIMSVAGSDGSYVS